KTGNHIVVDQLSPKSMQWTLGVQHVFHKDYTVEVRYVGTRGIHLNTQERINRQPLTTSTIGLPTYLSNPGQAALDALPYTRSGIAAGAYGNGNRFVPAYTAAGCDGPGQTIVQLAQEKCPGELGSWAHLYLPVSGMDDRTVWPRRKRQWRYGG